MWKRQDLMRAQASVVWHAVCEGKARGREVSPPGLNPVACGGLKSPAVSGQELHCGFWRTMA